MVPIFSKITVISLSYISLYSIVNDTSMHVDLRRVAQNIAMLQTDGLNRNYYTVFHERRK